MSNPDDVLLIDMLNAWLDSGMRDMRPVLETVRTYDASPNSDPTLAVLDKIVTLPYMNYRGVIRKRSFLPRRLWWGSDEWHTTPQWLLTGFDVETNQDRHFSMFGFQFASIKRDEESRKKDGRIEGLVLANDELHVDMQILIKLLIDWKTSFDEGDGGKMKATRRLTDEALKSISN